MATCVLQYTYKWISAVQFGTHESDISDTSGKFLHGMTETSYDFLGRAHSGTQIVNIFK